MVPRSPDPRTRRRAAAFDRTLGAWREEADAAAALAAPGGAALSLVTWNVWFGEHRFPDRAAALIEVLRRCDADVICLQEVTPPLLDTLLGRRWVREGYRVSDAAGGSVDPYGVLVLTRLPLLSLRCQELPTSMGRSLVLAELLAGGRRLAVGAVHLESQRHNADRRREQLAVVLPVLRAAAPDAVLCGDLNIDEERLAEPRLPPDFLDLWPALRGAAPGYTMDTEANRMTEIMKGTVKRVRYDRVLLHSPQRTWRAATIEIIGTEPIAAETPDVFPSDHFGLLARLEAGRSGG